MLSLDDDMHCKTYKKCDACYLVDGIACEDIKHLHEHYGVHCDISCDAEFSGRFHVILLYLSLKLRWFLPSKVWVMLWVRLLIMDKDTSSAFVMGSESSPP